MAKHMIQQEKENSGKYQEFKKHSYEPKLCFWNMLSPWLEVARLMGEILAFRELLKKLSVTLSSQASLVSLGRETLKKLTLAKRVLEPEKVPYKSHCLCLS